MVPNFWITRLLNHLFAPVAVALMNMVGVHPADPARPINDTFALEVLVALCLVVFFLIVRFTLRWKSPTPRSRSPR